MKKFHIALSVSDLDASIKDYSQRLGLQPTLVVENHYALWRTDCLNVSLRVDSNQVPGNLRHLGWEDSTAEAFSHEEDVNGVVWERFTAQQQAEEINELWPQADYHIND